MTKLNNLLDKLEKPFLTKRALKLRSEILSPLVAIDLIQQSNKKLTEISDEIVNGINNALSEAEGNKINELCNIVLCDEIDESRKEEDAEGNEEQGNLRARLNKLVENGGKWSSDSPVDLGDLNDVALTLEDKISSLCK